MLFLPVHCDVRFFAIFWSNVCLETRNLNTRKDTLIDLSSTERCSRMLEYNDSISGCILVGHVIKKIEISSPDVCEIHCFKEADCVSFNVIPLRDGKHRCELSDSDHRKHPWDMFYEAGATYTPVVVIIMILIIIMMTMTMTKYEDDDGDDNNDDDDRNMTMI